MVDLLTLIEKTLVCFAILGLLLMINTRIDIAKESKALYEGLAKEWGINGQLLKDIRNDSGEAGEPNPVENDHGAVPDILPH